MTSTYQSILQSLEDVTLVDPHSHINPYSPASTTLADILGYHYYTELAHSAGMAKSQIESPGLHPKELVSRLVSGLPHLTNTAQYAWLIDICKRFFDFGDDVIDESNWESLYDAAEKKMQVADWADSVLEQSNVKGVFLTNDFDDKLTGFDTKTYIPCLRTDDLVFHLANPEVRDRLAVCSGIGIDGSLKSLRDAIEQRVEHFVSHGARACAISLPPEFSPAPVLDGRAATALDAVLRNGPSADESHKAAIARRVFWTIVELCDEYKLPMDLMIGVNRGVYAGGVHQGRDLYDSRVSLIQYRELFNTFPEVMFPVSVLASVTNQELVSYAWIFPNVITNGHWWYSNTPSFIKRDAAARLEAVPRNKQIGYYSDAYKLEFIGPKFGMYRRILASILFEDFVVSRGWSEEDAIKLGYQILRGNVDALFPDRSPEPSSESGAASDVIDESLFGAPVAIAAVAGGTLAAIQAAADELPPIDESESLTFADSSDDDLDMNDDESIDDELILVDVVEEIFVEDAEVFDPDKTDDSLSHSTIVEGPLANAFPTNETSEVADEENLLMVESDESDEAVEESFDPFMTIADSELRVSRGEHSEESPPQDVDDLDFGPLLDLEESKEGDADAPEPEEIRFFRGDEEPGKESQSDFDINATLDAIGMNPDPSTGELTMEASDNEIGELDETYLIPEDDEPLSEPEKSSFEKLATVQYDAMEMPSMEDDDLEFLLSDEGDVVDNFDLDQTINFQFDDDESETEKND